jgi:protein-S-isoprenylcysteine O-methyltransferase Ste14
MSLAAALVAVVWFLVALVGRTVVQWRRTGDSGLRVRTSPPGERVVFGAAIAVMLVALVAAAVGALDPVAALDRAGVRWAGLVTAIVGAVATVVAQLDLGASWRIGVDPDERTDLVTGGLFAVARNPIFTAMIVTVVGLAFASPTWLALAGAAVTVLSIELQVRRVEEPYLLATHGAAYRQYAAGVGRFVPVLGRLS